MRIFKALVQDKFPEQANHKPLQWSNQRDNMTTCSLTNFREGRQQTKELVRSAREQLSRPKMVLSLLNYHQYSIIFVFFKGTVFSASCTPTNMFHLRGLCILVDSFAFQNVLEGKNGSWDLKTTGFAVFTLRKTSKPVFFSRLTRQGVYNEFSDQVKVL